MQKEASASSNSSGTAAVIFGILAVLSFTIIPGIILGILALVFGIAQRRAGKNSWSLAGIILGIIGIVFSILAILAIVQAVLGFQEYYSQVEEQVSNCLSNPNSSECSSPEMQQAILIQCSLNPEKAGCQEFASSLEGQNRYAQ